MQSLTFLTFTYLCHSVGFKNIFKLKLQCSKVIFPSTEGEPFYLLFSVTEHY